MEAIGLIEGNRTYSEDDLLPISALQHLLYCERQCALIHLEQAWQENRFTAEGRVQHERVHELSAEQRGKVRIVRGLRLRSLQIGLIGVADVVEFHASDDSSELSIPFPVEYKRGKPKRNRCDEVQLCAQALCLEEMLARPVPAGALFYGKTRRRKNVVFDHQLRTLTQDSAQRLQNLIQGGHVPPAIYAKKCDACSLQEICMPKITKSALRYITRCLNDIADGESTT